MPHDRLLLAAALTAAISYSAACGQLVFEGLGERADVAATVATCLSADGLVVRGEQFVWTREHGLKSMPYLYVRAMSADGSVVAGDGFIWTASTGMVGTDFNAIAMNADGTVIVGNRHTPPSGAVRWTAQTGAVLIGNAPDGSEFHLTAISGDGQTLAGLNTYDNSLAFRWRAGAGFFQLREECPYGAGPRAINPDGTVIAGTISRALAPYGCIGAIGIWRGESNPEFLHFVDPRSGTLWPVEFRAMSRNASVFAALVSLPIGQPRPAIWVDGEAFFVDEAIRAAQGDLTGWEITDVTALNQDGSVMIGRGLHNGRGENWIARGSPRFHRPCLADLGVAGGFAGIDGRLDNNDFIAFLGLFFTTNPAADMGRAGGLPGPDGSFDNNDFIVFINRFFAGCQ